MLRRKPTRIELDMSDVKAYEDRVTAREQEREAREQAEMLAAQQARMMQENAGEGNRTPNFNAQGPSVLGQGQQGNRQKTRNESYTPSTRPPQPLRIISQISIPSFYAQVSSTPWDWALLKCKCCTAWLHRLGLHGCDLEFSNTRLNTYNKRLKTENTRLGSSYLKLEAKYEAARDDIHKLLTENEEWHEYDEKWEEWAHARRKQFEELEDELHENEGTIRWLR